MIYRCIQCETPTGGSIICDKCRDNNLKIPRDAPRTMNAIKKHKKKTPPRRT